MSNRETGAVDGRLTAEYVRARDHMGMVRPLNRAGGSLGDGGCQLEIFEKFSSQQL